MEDGAVQLVIAQMEEVQSKHPALVLAQEPDGELRVRGRVGFSIEHDGHTVTDDYEIELHIPDHYPASPPCAYEPEGKVPESFHKYPQSLELCLGAPVEVRRKFFQHKNLLTFIDNQVIYDYLFAYTFKRDHGYLPHGDLEHGAPGILQYYKDFFGVDTLAVTKLLKLLAEDPVSPSVKCPCKQGKKLTDCHGSKLDELRPHYWPSVFESELKGILRIKEVAEIMERESELLRERQSRNKQRRARKQTRKGGRR